MMGSLGRLDSLREQSTANITPQAAPEGGAVLTVEEKLGVIKL
jgi:hypothetical protein